MAGEFVRFARNYERYRMLSFNTIRMPEGSVARDCGIVLTDEELDTLVAGDGGRLTTWRLKADSYVGDVGLKLFLRCSVTT